MRIASGLILILLAAAVLVGAGSAVDVRTWDELHNNVTDGNVVRLMDNIQCDDEIEISGITWTLDLNGHNLTADDNKRLVRIYDESSFTLKDSSGGGALKGGNPEDNLGGGVYVESGTFNMTGGSIIDCTSNPMGSGGGSGVYVASGSIFNMTGGNITNCKVIGYTGTGGGVYNKGTFTMSGGNITGCTASTCGGVYNKGTFTMSGGNITGCTASACGGGVYVASSSIFNMIGGSITGCNAGSAGGGVYVDGGGSFTMTGGNIIGCFAKSGGGVSNLGTFTMSGGNITSCRAPMGDGGGVSNMVMGTFTMSGGNITDCTATNGGGVFNNNFMGTFTMSGTALVDGDNEVYLPTGNFITLGTGGFSSPAYGAFNITSQSTTTDTKIVDGSAVSSGLLKIDNFRLSPSMTKFMLKIDDAGTNLVLSKAYAMVNETGVKYGSVEDAFKAASPGQTVKLLDNSLLTSGLIYIDGITYKNSTTLDLNGHTLTAKSGSQLFQIAAGFSLNLTDTSDAKNGQLKGNGTYSDFGAGVRVIGTFNMSSGNLTGCKSEKSGGGVCVDEGGTFNMFGGNITGCNAFVGGGVFIAKGGNFNMENGNINTCSANTDGGAVCVDKGKFTMSGGNIIGCSAHNLGGGVSVFNGATFNISNGNIDNCKVSGGSVSGGGVHVSSSGSTFNMFGGNITNCHVMASSLGVGGGVEVRQKSVFNMYNGNITGCTATTIGGGVCTYNNGLFTMKGGNITDCTADSKYGNNVVVYIMGKFALSGSPKLSDVTLLKGRTITIDSAVTPVNKIGITISDNEYQLTSGVFAIGSKAADSKDAFESCVSSYSVMVNSLSQLELAIPVAEDNAGNKYATVEDAFKGVTAGGTITLLADSNLTTEITIDGSDVNSTTLNLNGFTLTAAENQRLFTINSGQSFNLTDSTGSGALKGNGTVTDNGGGVLNEGTFNMTGGSITYCNATDPECGDGGGVYNEGSFDMTGGSITNCNATSNYGGGGGGVLNSGTLTMSGSSSITNCNAMDGGGGGGVLNRGTLTMSGSSSITNCNAMNGGGGVANAGTFNISGSPKITGNTNSTSIKENVGLIQGWSEFNLVGNYNGDGIGISVYTVMSEPVEPKVGDVFGNATGQYTGADKIFSDRNPNFVGLLSPVAANGQDYQIVWKDTTPTPVPPTPKPTVVPTARPSSGGGSTNTGAGHYTQYPRQVSNTDTISFGSSQIVSSVDLSNPTTGTVTVYYDTDSTYKNNQNYAADASAQTSAEGGEGVTVKTAGIKGAPVLVSSPEKEGSISFYETFRIESDLKDGKVTEINFKVAKSGLLTNGVTKTDVILYHGLVDAKNNGEWIPLNTYLTGEDKTYAYYKAYTDGTSPFAIVFMEDMTIVDETVQEPVPVDTSEPAVHQTVTAVPTTVPTQAQTPVQTQASKSPLMLGGIIAGLAAAGVLLGRRE